MRAVYWQCDDTHPVKDLIFDIIGVYPRDHEVLHDIMPEPESDDLIKDASSSPSVYLLNALEEMYEVDLTDQMTDQLLGGELDVGFLCHFFDNMNKSAAITTPEERARSAVYRASHKEEIRRKSKKRRRLISQGLKQKMRRIGDAVSGYRYVVDSNAGMPASGRAPVSGLASDHNFNPTRETVGLTDRTKMSWR